MRSKSRLLWIFVLISFFSWQISHADVWKIEYISMPELDHKIGVIFVKRGEVINSKEDLLNPEKAWFTRFTIRDKYFNFFSESGKYFDLRLVAKTLLEEVSRYYFEPNFTVLTNMSTKSYTNFVDFFNDLNLGCPNLFWRSEMLDPYYDEDNKLSVTEIVGEPDFKRATTTLNIRLLSIPMGLEGEYEIDRTFQFRAKSLSTLKEMKKIADTYFSGTTFVNLFYLAAFSSMIFSDAQDFGEYLYETSRSLKAPLEAKGSHLIELPEYPHPQQNPYQELKISNTHSPSFIGWELVPQAQSGARFTK